jgi:hypothetical protein
MTFTVCPLDAGKNLIHLKHQRASLRACSES